MHTETQKIKVLVADDSAFMRMILTDIINGDPALTVIDAAKNGEEACKLAKELKPDVITLDVEMPFMDGLTALEKIMQERPTPVVMLSALTQKGATATIAALEIGAVDFIAKPSGNVSVDFTKLSQEIIAKIKTAAKAKIASYKPLSAAAAMTQYKSKQDLAGFLKTNFSLIVIGTSTGGPRALHEVLSALPEGLNIAILIVQHMPPDFTKSLAERLNHVSPFKVKEAAEGDLIEKGHAYVAPGNYHMEIVQRNNDLCIHLSQAPPMNGHRPSVDMLFNSAAKIKDVKIGVIMTGMGNDGALGMKAMKDSGIITIGESAETCVVYGMPKSAYKLGAVLYEVPLFKISNQILQVLRS